jgi:hypothetical protein
LFRLSKKYSIKVRGLFRHARDVFDGNLMPGPPQLEKQVAVVTALMRISPDWDSFMRNFNRNFRPHLPEQRDLFEEMEPIPDIIRDRPKRNGLVDALHDLNDEAAH